MRWIEFPPHDWYRQGSSFIVVRDVQITNGINVALRPEGVSGDKIWDDSTMNEFFCAQNEIMRCTVYQITISLMMDLMKSAYDIWDVGGVMKSTDEYSTYIVSMRTGKTRYDDGCRYKET